MTPAPDQEPALDGLTPLRVGVVVPRRRLAWVRVMHEALAEHHPAATLTALVLDGVSDAEPFAQVSPDDVIADTAHWHRLAMLLRPEELARAFAPALALHLLSAEGPPVLLLADDVLVRGPLDDLARLSREHGTVLVPRRRSPLPNDGRRPDAADMAKTGRHRRRDRGSDRRGEPADRLVGTRSSTKAGWPVAKNCRFLISRPPNSPTSSWRIRRTGVPAGTSTRRAAA